MSSTPDSPMPKKGWYPDPTGSDKLRWWDGEKWTQRVQDPPPEPEPDAPAAASPATARAPGPMPSASPLAAPPTAKSKKPWYQRPLPLVGVGFVALILVAAVAGGGSDKKQSSTGDSAAPSPQATTDDTATTEAPATEPAPDPEVSVTFSGPSSVHRDDVVLRGTVDPASAHVRIRGHAAEVSHGHWKLPVTLSRHGDNTFHVLATRKGYVKATDDVVVTRKRSAAEKAVARRERAERRANMRALDSAESYLASSSFSKQGLFEQLSSSAGEGFTTAQAQYAVDHVDADWKQEAVESARSYLQSSSFSRSALIEQLTSSAGEGFTYEQAIYAVNKVY